MALKFGRLPAVRTPRTEALGRAMARALEPLGAPPAQSNDYYSPVERQVGGSGGWGMLGNDQWGDCVEADEGHYLMLRTANAGTMVVPTADQVLALYSAETGFNPSDPNTDQGTNEASDCAFMVSTGFLDHKAAATGPIDYTNLNNMRWAIQLFGACKIGFNIQQAQVDQFNSGNDWGYVSGSQTVGGHDVPLVAYYTDGSFDAISWGRRVHCAPSFVATASGLIDEAHALIFPDWIEANGAAPSGFDLQQLLIDASEIEGTGPQTGTHSHRWHIKRRRRHARLGIT
jgi:hypothetical protein